MASGLASDQVRALREAFNPDFESTSFDLAVPTLDDKFAKSLKQTGNKAVEKQEKLLMSHQFKLLDLARPLLNALSLTNEGSTKEALESTLSLWAVAFKDLSKSRRKAVLAATDPGFVHLLSKPENFSRYEIGQLFGRRFSDAIVQEAKEETTLRNARQSVKQTNSRRKRFNRKHSRPEGKGDQQASNSNRPAEGSSAPPQYFNRYPFPSQSNVSVGARVSLFAEAWESITRDRWILDLVEKVINSNSCPNPRSPVGRDQFPFLKK
jgi:hypothetical protein